VLLIWKKLMILPGKITISDWLVNVHKHQIVPVKRFFL